MVSTRSNTTPFFTDTDIIMDRDPANTMEAIREGEANGTASLVWHATERGIMALSHDRYQHGFGARVATVTS